MLRRFSRKLLGAVYKIDSKVDPWLESPKFTSKGVPIISPSCDQVGTDKVFHQVYLRMRKCANLKRWGNLWYNVAHQTVLKIAQGQSENGRIVQQGKRKKVH